MKKVSRLIRMLRRISTCVVGLLLISAILFAQGPSPKIYVGPSTDVIIHWAQPSDFPSASIPFCRGYYTSDRQEANGSGWWTDYPGADHNFLIRLAELTTMKVGKPVVVRLDSPLLFHCPLLYMSDVGTLALSAAEAQNLRLYLLKGGFLWVDDFWGPEAWNQWIREIRKVLPDNHIAPIPPTHPIFSTVYTVKGIWQMPTTGIWALNHDISERGDDSETPHIDGIVDGEGRLIVISTFNTDIADGFEAAEQDQNIEYFATFSRDSYAFGVNVLAYALTH